MKERLTLHLLIFMLVIYLNLYREAPFPANFDSLKVNFNNMSNPIDLLTIGNRINACHRQYNPFYINGIVGLRCDMKETTNITGIEFKREEIFLFSNELTLRINPNTSLDGQLYRNALSKLNVEGTQTTDFKNTINREGPEDPRYFLGEDGTVYIQYTAPNPLKEIYPSVLMWISPLFYFTEDYIPSSIVDKPTPVFINSSKIVSEEKNWIFFINHSNLYAIYSSEPYQLMYIENKETAVAQNSYFKNHSCVSYWANEINHFAIHLGSNLLKVEYSSDLVKFGFTRDAFLGISHIKYWNNNGIGYYNDVYVFYDSLYPFLPFKSILYTPAFYENNTFVYSSSLNAELHPINVNTTVFVGYGYEDDNFGFHDIKLVELLEKKSRDC